MRIWDIHPGYLNRQSLLGEHRELHGIVSIITHKKKGYARHPETRRWVGYGWALRQRHRLLAAEMNLRGYTDKTPVLTHSKKGIWPDIYIDYPARQYQILTSKYQHKAPGRIPLPRTAQELWGHHKYSVLARGAAAYKHLNRIAAAIRPHHDFSRLAIRLTEIIRTPPTNDGIKKTLEHMWEDVSGGIPASKGSVASWSVSRLLAETQQRALTCGETPHLTAATALSELKAWLPVK